MIRFLKIKNGHEETVNLMIPIKEGMHKELLSTLEHLDSIGQKVGITCGKMSNEEYKENNIKSLMYGECCTREEAIEILGANSGG